MKYISGAELSAYLINNPEEYKKYIAKKNELREFVGSMIVGNSRPTVSSLCFNGSRLRYGFNIVVSASNDSNIGFLANSLPYDRVRAMYFTNRIYETFLGDKYQTVVNRKQRLKDDGARNVTIPSLLSIETSYHLYNYYKQIQKTITDNPSVYFKSAKELDTFLKNEKAKYIMDKNNNFCFSPNLDIVLESKPILPSSKVKKMYDERQSERNGRCKTLFEPYVLNGLELQDYMVSRIGKVYPNVSDKDTARIEKHLENERKYFLADDKNNEVNEFISGNVGDVLERVKEKEKLFAMANALSGGSKKKNVDNVNNSNSGLIALSSDMKEYLASKFEGTVNFQVVEDYIKGLEEKSAIIKKQDEDLIPYRFAQNSSAYENEGQLDIFGEIHKKEPNKPSTHKKENKAKNSINPDNQGTQLTFDFEERPAEKNNIIIDEDGQCKLM